MRRISNMNEAEGAEDELWKSLFERRDQVQRKLRHLAAGHPDEAVRTFATRAARLVYNAAVQSKSAVYDTLARRPNRQHWELADDFHEAAGAAVTHLGIAVQHAGRRPDWLPWWVKRPWQIPGHIQEKRIIARNPDYVKVE